MAVSNNNNNFYNLISNFYCIFYLNNKNKIFIKYNNFKNINTHLLNYHKSIFFSFYFDILLLLLFCKYSLIKFESIDGLIFCLLIMVVNIFKGSRF